MPYKFTEGRRHTFSKAGYQVTNWPEYDAALVRRGSLTVWFTEEAVAAWHAPTSRERGGQPLYSATAIETGLTLRLVFHQSLRQTEGLLHSIADVLGVNIAIPDHTTLISLHDTSVGGGHMRDEGKQSDSIICDACGTAVPSYDVVSYGSIELGYRELCNCCFNTEVASVLGLERFEHVGLHPVVMTDCAGEKHEFHFRIRLHGPVMALDAFELKTGAPGGYQFQILGKPDDEPLLLLGNLIERIRRNLSVRHLVRGECGTQIADRTVCGRIEWDESEDGRVPLLVIDGQEVSWDEFGRMLMSFEGWQLRVAIRDRSEDV